MLWIISYNPTTIISREVKPSRMYAKLILKNFYVRHIQRSGNPTRIVMFRPLLLSVFLKRKSLQIDNSGWASRPMNIHLYGEGQYIGWRHVLPHSRSVINRELRNEWMNQRMTETWLLTLGGTAANEATRTADTRYVIDISHLVTDICSATN